MRGKKIELPYPLRLLFSFVTYRPGFIYFLCNEMPRPATRTAHCATLTKIQAGITSRTQRIPLLKKAEYTETSIVQLMIFTVDLKIFTFSFYNFFFLQNYEKNNYTIFNNNSILLFFLNTINIFFIDTINCVKLFLTFVHQSGESSYTSKVITTTEALLGFIHGSSYPRGNSFSRITRVSKL